MSNIDKQAVTAKTKELASLMVERFSMNPVSCKLLNEAWEKEFPDEVAIAERMLALLDELEHYKSREERVTKLVLDNSTSWDVLYEKLEAAERRIAELEKGHQEAAKQINSWRRLAKQSIAERGKDISELEAARQRIAELEALEVTLPAEKFCPSEYAGSQYWEETEVWNKAISACAVAVRAAGIKVKGE